ncbi:MAG: hypothetical protein O7H41_16430 [Planctomycetota bacterium]|nr:hypothetical protein [Planctomycetota bacterium]
MKTVVAVLFSLVAATAAADDFRSTAVPPSEIPQNSPTRQPNLRFESSLEELSSPDRIPETTAPERSRDEFLWDPMHPFAAAATERVDCLDQVTEKNLVPRKRQGLYRYLRKRAVRFYKRYHKGQIRRARRTDPSYTYDDEVADSGAWYKAARRQAWSEEPPRISGISGGPPRELCARQAYVARLGPLRIDEGYRLEIDLQDLWSPEDPEYDPVPGQVAPARSLRKTPERRWVDVKISPRVNLRVGNGFRTEDLLSNYGGRVRFSFLPNGTEGPLFSSSIRLKVRLDGRAQITLNIIEKRF